MPSGGRFDRQHYVVGLVIAAGVFTIYVALGGPLPFIVEGGPALDSVPAEADAVVYSDAWTFSSDTSRDVADGLLTATNESVPGYAGPASLDAAFETLQETDLDERQLRSITAFTAYGSQGQPTDYTGVVLKTGWNTENLLTAFGDDRANYTQLERQGKTVYVHDNESRQFAWVAKLGPDRFVLGNASAVRGSIDATVGREQIDPTLESGFRSLPRGPIRFASTVPEQLPGQALAPRSITETVAAIETFGGVYYPEGGDAAVELEMTTTDAETAEQIEPAVASSIGFARGRVPESTDDLLAGATVTQQSESVTVQMSGSTDGFVDGYQAILETNLVRLLLGQRVGTPPLELVPSNTTLMGYADAGVVADPTTVGIAQAVLDRQAGAPGEDLVNTVLEIDRLTALDPTELQSVTLFALAEDTQPAQNATNVSGSGIIVEANWSREEVFRTIDNGTVQYDNRTVSETPVFALDTADGERWVAVLDSHVALGSPDAVRSVIAVERGEREAVGGRMRTAFEGLPGRDVTTVFRLPDGLENSDSGVSIGPIDLSDLAESSEVVGVSYQSDRTTVDIRANLHMASVQDAVETRGLLELGRQFVRGGTDDTRVQAILDATDLSQSGRVVSGTAETDSESIVALTEWVLDRLESVPLTTIDSVTGPPDIDSGSTTGGLAP